MSGTLPQWLKVCVILVPVCAETARAQPAGLPPEWEVRKNLDALVEQVQKLQPILKEVNVEEWAQKGAPEAYKAQLKSASSELEYLGRTTEELSKEPERLTLALEAYFRMQSMESMLNSIGEGVRKYQNPALADLLQEVMNNNATHRDKLREYVVQLARAKEQEYKVMNEEAQRCRQMLSRQPPARKTPATRKESK